MREASAERLAGRWDLVGFNGRLLPVELEDDSEPENGLRAFLLESAPPALADPPHRRAMAGGGRPTYSWVRVRRRESARP